VALVVGLCTSTFMMKGVESPSIPFPGVDTGLFIIKVPWGIHDSRTASTDPIAGVDSGTGFLSPGVPFPGLNDQGLKRVSCPSTR